MARSSGSWRDGLRSSSGTCPGSNACRRCLSSISLPWATKRPMAQPALAEAPSLRVLETGKLLPVGSSCAAARVEAPDLRGIGSRLAPGVRTPRRRTRSGWQARRWAGQSRLVDEASEPRRRRWIWAFCTMRSASSSRSATTCRSGRLDSSYYDLLASEARLASLVAVARREVPVEHWFALGRPFGVAGEAPSAALLERHHVRVPDAAALQPDYENSLLDPPATPRSRGRSSTRAGAAVPWGMSEAAFSALDAHRIYQYQAFGVPGLALKRGVEDDLVVAPYASALALLRGAAGGGSQPEATGPAGRHRPLRLLRRHRLHAPAPCRRTSPASSCAPTWPITRA